MISRLLNEFRAAVNVDEVRIKRPTQIFLCGGEIPNPDIGGPAKCGRHFFYRYLQQTRNPLAANIVLAETIVQDSDQEKHGFKDLLALERLVAEIVAVILLFVESTGSFAELGAFTEDQEILKSLVAVIDNRYRERTNSFVYLGPIKRLLNHDEKSLLYASWQDADGTGAIIEESAAKMADSLCQHLPQVLRRNGLTGLLSTATAARSAISEGERMCLITGLLDVFLALSLAETEETLSAFSPLPSGMEITRYLYVLRKLGLVDRISHSGQSWYFAPKSFVEWSFTPASAHKEIREWKRYFRDEYKRAQATDTFARKRVVALKQIVERLGGEL